MAKAVGRGDVRGALDATEGIVVDVVLGRSLHLHAVDGAVVRRREGDGGRRDRGVLQREGEGGWFRGEVGVEVDGESEGQGRLDQGSRVEGACGRRNERESWRVVDRTGRERDGRGRVETRGRRRQVVEGIKA